MKDVRLKRLYEVVDERAGSRRPPLLSVSIHRGVVLRSSMTEDEHRADDLSTYKLVRAGDIVLNRMRAFQGAVGRSETAGLVSPDYLVLRLASSVEGRYLHHLFRSMWFVAQMSERLRGIGSTDQGNVRTPRINEEDLGEIVLRLPTLLKQRTIADFLDTETARINALIIKKRRMIDLLNLRFAVTVVRTVTGSDRPGPRCDSGINWIGDLPSDWGKPWLGAYFQTQLGKMLNAEAAAGAEQYQYLRNVNVQWDRFDMDDLATMHFSAEDRARCELRHGDLLVCEGGEVGRSAVWPGKSPGIYFQKAIHRVRPLGNGNTRFLMYCLRAAAHLNVFAIEGNQSTIVHLTGEKLREHRFPWPPLDQQHQIVEMLDARRDQLAELTWRLHKQVDLLQEHRNALITAAVTEQLEVPGAAA